jgi:hypothetical protein
MGVTEEGGGRIVRRVGRGDNARDEEGEEIVSETCPDKRGV